MGLISRVSSRTYRQFFLMFRQLTISLLNLRGIGVSPMLRGVPTVKTPPRRTSRYTKEEVSILEQTFQKQLFVDQPTRSRLAKHMDRTEKAISMWFARRRENEKVNDEHNYAALQLQQKGLNGSGNKNYSKFTDIQRKQLAAVFQETQDLTDVMVDKLTDDMMVEKSDILNWFRERRYRSKMKIGDGFESGKNGSKNGSENWSENDVPMTNAEKNKIQAKSLGEYFEENIFVNDIRANEISEAIGITEKKVKNMFRTRRAKLSRNMGKEAYEDKILSGDFTGVNAVDLNKKPEK